MIKVLVRAVAPLTFALALPLGAAAQSTAVPSCPANDPVVWINTSSHVYHLKGDAYFGKTKHGQYACRSKADAMGAHLAKSASKSGGAMNGGAMSGTGAGASDGSATTDTAATSSGKKKKHHSGAMASPTP